MRHAVSIVGVLLSLVGHLMAIDGARFRDAAQRSGDDRSIGNGAAGRGVDDRVRSRPLRLGVPAYWAAGAADGAAAFERLIAAAPTVDTVIVNGPASGPADPFDHALAAVIRRLRAERVTVLGYVDTGYLGRTGQVTTRVAAGSTAIADWRAQAIKDATAWQELYAVHGLGGIFLDQTPPSCGDNGEYLEAYRTIRAAARQRDPDAVLAINPGNAVEECYASVADIIVIAEDSLPGYRTWQRPAWVGRYQRDRFWHLVHGAATAEQLTEALALAGERHAGRVFVTDAVLDGRGGPWNVLPADPYWSAEVRAVTAAAEERCPIISRRGVGPRRVGRTG